MDKQQIIDYIMHTPSNTNPAMLGQFLDEYSEGSGSSGDWSTAEVTVISQGNQKTITIPNIVQVPEEAAGFYPTNTLLVAKGVLNGTETTLIVPLYNGCCVFSNEEADFTSSGSISQLSNNGAIIAGDCTITLDDGDDSFT